MTTVVLYNASYEPLGHVSFHHAVRMLVREVAVVHEAAGEKMIGPYQWPKALRLVRYVAAKWLHRPAGWTKRGVLARDRHKCGYCGAHANTIDHVDPALARRRLELAQHRRGLPGLQRTQGQPHPAPRPGCGCRPTPGTPAARSSSPGSAPQLFAAHLPAAGFAPGCPFGDVVEVSAPER